MLETILSFIPANESKLLTLFGACATVLSLLFGLIGKTAASKFFGAISPADLIRIWKYLLMILQWIKRWQDTRKVINGLITLGVIAFFCGCSLEAARARRINTQLAAGGYSAPATPRQASQCEVWDGVHVWGDWVAGGSATVGAGAGLVASQTGDGTRTAALTMGIAAGAVSLVSLGVAEVSAKTWTERCGQ